MTNNPCYKAGRKITVKGLMLHSVGTPQPSAKVFITKWNKSSYDRACVHGFIDANDGTVYQTLPWNHRGWHCGAYGNNTHIGVEMCEPASIKYTGGASFTYSDKAAAQAAVKRTYTAAVELFAYLCGKFGLDPLRDGVIVSHKEGHARGIASNHGDPEHLWTQLDTGYTMDSFRQDVKAAMEPDKGNAALDDAIQKLAKLGVLNSPDYWKKTAGTVKYLDTLLIKAATSITGKGVRSASVAEGVDQLVKDGIINAPDYWLEHYQDDPNLGALLCALGGAAK